jgi:hypothetical protein
MVCSSSTPMRSAVLIVLKVSCLVLLKPMKGAIFGSHSSLMLRLGYRARSLPSLVRGCIAVSCSSWGDAFSALFITTLEGRRKKVDMWACVRCISRKDVRMLMPRVRAHIMVSNSMAISLRGLSAWFQSLPSLLRFDRTLCLM